MRIFIYIIFLSLCFTGSVQADWQKATHTLSASDQNSGDYFGWSVDSDAHFAIVGAPNESMGGAAYVFKKDASGEWVEFQKLENPNMPTLAIDNSEVYAGSFGYSVAIAESSSTLPSMLVVGASTSSVYIDGNSTQTGAACMYAFNSNSNLWEQQGTCLLGLIGSIENSQSSFGYSVDITNWTDFIPDQFGNGGTLVPKADIVVGDPDYDMKYTDVGAAAFLHYKANDNNWSAVAFQAGFGDWNNSFGQSVAIFHNTVIVSAIGHDIEDPNDDDPNNVLLIHDVGEISYFEANGTFISSYTPPHEESAGEHHFGYSVDIYGNYSVVSEEHREGNHTKPALYIMKHDPVNGWVPEAYIENDANGYGFSVAIDEKHIAVGAPFDRTQGSVFVYGKDDNGNWQTTEPFYWLDVIKYSSFGISVALYDDDLFVGAPAREEVKEFYFVDTQTIVNPAIIMYLLN